MYAYVKFLSGPLKDKKKIVETSCIQHFHKETHRKIMKYQIKHDKQLYPGCILLLSGSKEKIRELMDKRRSQSVPSHLLMSAPEETNSDTDNAIEQSKSLPPPNTENVSDSRMPFEDISNELHSVMVKNTNDSDEAGATQKPEKKSLGGHSDNKDIFEKKAIEKKQSSKNIKIQQIANVHSVAECKVNYEELKKIKAELCKVKKKNKELEAENKRLKDTNRELKEKLQAKKSELQKVRNMNEDLQLSVIEKSKKHNVMIEKLTKSTTGQILYQNNFPSIGSLRTTDNCPRVHIGRDQWIDDKSYNKILNSSSTPRQCACNILTAVFLEETLLVSTRTGLESNRKIRGRKECPKLDETKYGACEDFYIY
ncbi:uncharacterized protein LOC143895406 [Temnothorax americanus]|uniref:uncharacterized protein LOC143895406 n=1 Tax=Temnothorax americanus TaxID=1964332 RepID=UPI00406783D2